ncbi:MAG: hypothetical protein JO296_06305 [Pseudonocardiales bacterium]|nr:hypothetical protein [Pseudonocardiales bacterium]
MPAGVVPAVQANRALPTRAVGRDACVMCVLELLFTALKRRDVFARLLDRPRWETMATTCRLD